MGLIDRSLNLVFGGGRNVVAETAEVFRVNAEADAARDAEARRAALAQFAAEFGGAKASRFDRIIDGLNRVPRPAMAFGTLGLFVSAMVAPLWFAERMTGIALVPEPLWWLLAAIVSFYFGARHQSKGQDFQREIAASLARAPQVAAQIEGLSGMRNRAEPEEQPAEPEEAETEDTKAALSDNPALMEWQTRR